MSHTNKNKQMLWVLLAAVCAASLGLEFVAAPEVHFSFGHFFGFNAVLAALACAVLILIARGLGIILKKPTDHYDD
ncbi:MAG TPA: hypothetical protein VJ934_03520 [Desulfomicrobiaceae bacterium]|jgi:hypothetical protein|nr:hypothetical protein [Desulfomicrobiaceae bacterium]